MFLFIINNYLQPSVNPHASVLAKKQKNRSNLTIFLIIFGKIMWICIILAKCYFCCKMQSKISFFINLVILLCLWDTIWSDVFTRLVLEKRETTWGIDDRISSPFPSSGNIHSIFSNIRSLNIKEASAIAKYSNSAYMHAMCLRASDPGSQCTK